MTALVRVTAFRRLLMLVVAALMALQAMVAGGCTGATPCEQITKAGWTCSLQVTEPLVPGDLIWVGPNNNIVSAGLRPDQLGQGLVERPANIAAETRAQSWTFDLGVGVPAVPGLAGVPGARGQLETAGVRKITMDFRDTKVRGISADLDDFRRAKERAEQYLALMSVPQRNAIRRQAANAGGEIWLVMQTLESKVDGTFEKGTSVGASAAATIQGVAVRAGGTFKDEAVYRIQFDQPLAVAYRSIPIALPPETGPQSAEPFMPRLDARSFEGPDLPFRKSGHSH